jgi:dTDP-4-amino-4,6-dideoxygalactose transaminase
VKALPPTCTGPSISLTQFARAFSAAGDPNLPDWPLPPGRLILTHSARGAIALACNAWNLGPGDEALAPAYNCGCEIDALLAASLHVKFYRVDQHAQPDWDDCRRRVTGRTRLILVTHTFGRPLGLNDLGTWCRANGLRLLEDCAHALFSSHTNPPEAGRPHWEPVGGLGDAAIFSLPKTLPIPDGGILVFRSGAHISPPNVGELRRADVATVWREALPLLKNHLVQRSTVFRACYRLLRKSRQDHRTARPDDFSDMPASYYFDPALRRRRMSAVSARLAASCQPAQIVERRRSNYYRLLSQISRTGDVRPLFDDLPDGTCPLVLPLLALQRDELCRALRRHGVDAIPWWAGYHPAFAWDEFPEAAFLKDHVLALPVHQQLGPADIDVIAAVLHEVQSSLSAPERLRKQSAVPAQAPDHFLGAGR